MSKLISRTLSAFALAGLLIVPLANALDTGTVTLGGTVDSTLEVTSVATAGASTLDLSAGAHVAKVSDIEMSTNNDQGITLTATSGNLTKTGGQSIAFQVTSVPDSAAAPATFAIASGTNYVLDNGVGAGSFNVDLYIKYTPGASQDPGDYAGSIGLTVTDN